ncbi:hypothetical protein BD310DRAFT_942689 [Dichomitus squalens]|uniref:Uncharacterized protein n=1 Tax=Dichomitus squalens TaxID=114155 RepID=A0A4Q9PAY6_9APHY|nr:hypothetical protein BD310DRAFT_942689 [Dichomitus squalens]
MSATRRRLLFGILSFHKVEVLGYDIIRERTVISHRLPINIQDASTEVPLWLEFVCHPRHHASLSHFHRWMQHEGTVSSMMIHPQTHDVNSRAYLVEPSHNIWHQSSGDMECISRTKLPEP